MSELEISQDKVQALSDNPQSKFQFARLDVVLANGNNDDVATQGYNYLRVTGPSAAFAIRGFAGGLRGTLLLVEIDVAQALTISNLNTGSTAGNRIVTGTGADVVYSTPSALWFIYDDAYAGVGAWKLGTGSTASTVVCARAYHSTTQTSTENSWVTLALNSERFDNDTIHDTATNNSRLTCNTAGKYQISGNAEFAGGGSTQGLRAVRILLNGTTVIAQQTVSATQNVVHALNLTTLYDLAVNDYAELQVYCTNTGVGNLTINASGNYSPEFGMVRVAE